MGILGAGLMGAGIAQVTLDKGIKTIMKDTNDAGITRGIHQVQTGVDGKVKRKKISRYIQLSNAIQQPLGLLIIFLGLMGKKLCQALSRLQTTNTLKNWTLL